MWREIQKYVYYQRAGKFGQVEHRQGQGEEYWEGVKKKEAEGEKMHYSVNLKVLLSAITKYRVVLEYVKLCDTSKEQIKPLNKPLEFS